ncbi:MAG: twin-arginine translocase TatA/TatE family subunit [Armatimonadetes bacterium]|nr:twin-arginine translocase TatA/TatE family subunit [Armatimonadota bacterium]
MFPVAFFTGNPVEWGIILLIVIILFGGSKLAGVGKSMGEGIKEFKKATQDDDTTPPPAVTTAAPSSTTVVTSKPEEK